MRKLRKSILLPILLLLGSPAATLSAPGFDQALWMRFAKEADQFHRRLCGFPSTGFSPDPSQLRCDPAQGVFDARLWRAMQPDARKLFGGSSRDDR